MTVDSEEITRNKNIVFSREHSEAERIAAGDRLIQNHIANKRYGAVHVMALWRGVLMEIRERAGLAALSWYVNQGDYSKVYEMTWKDILSKKGKKAKVTWENGLPEKVKQAAKDQLSDAIEIAITKFVKEGNKEDLFEIERHPACPYANRLHAHEELEKLGGYDFMRDSFVPKINEISERLSNNPFKKKREELKRNGFEFADPPKKRKVPRRLLN